MNLKSILNKQNLNKLYRPIKSLPLAGKIGIGIGTFLTGRALLNSLYSNIYNVIEFPSMHSGKEISYSSYMTKNMTDFGSGWRGLTTKITELISYKNRGLSSIIKNSMTAFDNNGINLNKTMFKITKQKKHKMINMKDRIANPVLIANKCKSIGHIVI